MVQIYNRTWGSSEPGGEGELGEAAAGAVQARLRHLTARTAAPDHAHLMHKYTYYYVLCLSLPLIISKKYKCYLMLT